MGVKTKSINHYLNERAKYKEDKIKQKTYDELQLCVEYGWELTEEIEGTIVRAKQRIPKPYTETTVAHKNDYALIYSYNGWARITHPKITWIIKHKTDETNSNEFSELQAALEFVV